MKVMESGLPKVRVESDNLFFVEQIKRLVTNDCVTVDLFEESDEGESDIIVSDHVISFTGENVIFILKKNDIERAKKANNPLPQQVFTIGKCTETEIISALTDLSTKIIAERKEETTCTQLAGDLSKEKERADDYAVRLESAGKAQKRIMIPDAPLDDMDIHVVYEPFMEVSGDIFFIREIYNKIYIMVGDVTDHGYLAGMYGATLYALAENYIQRSSLMEQEIDMWAQYMSKAAKMFHPRGAKTGDPMLISLTANATFCVIDKLKCNIKFMLYGSGQEPPILIKGSGSVQSLKVDDGVGAPIGEFESPSKVYQKRFFPGDAVVLYTDGATEIFLDSDSGAKDAEKMYSSEKIESSIAKIDEVARASSSKIVTAIMDDASSFSISENLGKDNSKPNIADDLTLACIKWRGNGYD